MISYVRGEVTAVEKDKVIVDVGGVGYGVFMPEASMGMLPQMGEEIKLHTYLNVREDAMQLFGFLTRDDLEIFRLLIGVSGIGPKGGLSILSKLTADDLRFAVLSGDAKAISSAPGIGKKTAEKVIIELKDKLDLEEMLEPKDISPSAETDRRRSCEKSRRKPYRHCIGIWKHRKSARSEKVDLEQAKTVEDVLETGVERICSDDKSWEDNG